MSTRSNEPAYTVLTSFGLDKKFWGRGIATKALKDFLTMETTRPIFAKVAFDIECKTDRELEHLFHMALDKYGYSKRFGLGWR